uniref:Amiloride-sensitive sodium channel n=1 Tax=Macrostomum lignano TaxID=282301 RepID=A0A1I8FDZ4_9PLAT
AGARTDFFEFPDVTICSRKLSERHATANDGGCQAPAPVERAERLVDMIYGTCPRFFTCSTKTDMNASVAVRPFFTDEEEIDDIPGMKVVLHPRGVKPNMNGPHVDVAAQVQNRGRTERLRRVRIMQQEYLDTCGCLATHLPKPGRPASCHDINEHVLFRDIFYRRPTSKLHLLHYPQRQLVQIPSDGLCRHQLRHVQRPAIARLDCYQRVLDRQNREGVDTHGCPVLCRVKSHEVMPRYYQWPNSVKYSGKAVSNLATEALNEAKARAWTCGGLKDLVSNYEKSRLWIGASIVTLVEILELAMYARALLVHKKLADRKRNQVIVIKPHEQQQEEKPPGYNHSELETDQQMPEPKVEL